MNSLVQAKTWLKRSETKNRLYYRSLFLFNKTNKLRKFLHKAASSWQFEYFILIAILTSCALLTLQGPKPTHNWNDPFAISDLVLNGIFTLEAILKIIAYGFVLHPGAYLRDRWNFFDFVVVVSGIISDAITMFTPNNDRSVSLKAIRLFRVFRPLRLIAKSNNLKVVLDTIIKSFGTIIHVLLFIFLIIMLYAITGLELFSEAITTACINSTTGKLLYPITRCTQTSTTETLCSAFNATCSRSWSGSINGISSFKNILVGMQTVIQVITMEDWVWVSYDIADIVSPYATWIFFVSLILFGSYFAVDLLMGVLGNQYLRTKQSAETINVDENRKEERIVTKMKDNQPMSVRDQIKTKWRRIRKLLNKKCKPIIETKMFFYVTTLIVVVDVITSCVYAHVRNNENQKPLTYLLIKSAFLGTYMIELSLIGFGQGFRMSIKNGYYVFNIIISLMGVVEIIAAIAGDSTYVGLSIIRALTLIEVFKKTRFWGQLKTIMSSFFETIKGVASLLVLLFIVLTNYALLGNQLFGESNQNRDAVGTFDTFGSSLLLSFVLLTGDNWTTFMNREMENAPNTFIKVMAVVFYLSFVVVGNFILINVFLGIIVDNLTSDFEEQHEDEFENEKKKRKTNLILKSVGFVGKIYKENMKLKKLNKTLSSSKVNTSNEDCDGVLLNSHTSNKLNTSDEDGDGVMLNPYTSNNVNTSNEVCDGVMLNPYTSNNVNTSNEVCDGVMLNPYTSNNVNTSNEVCDGVMLNPYTSNKTNLLGYHEETDIDVTIKPSNTVTKFKKDAARSTMVEFIIENVKADLPDEDHTQKYRVLRMSMQANVYVRARARAFSMLINPETTDPFPKHKALWVFGQENPIRRWVFELVTSSKFTVLVCVLIVLSSLVMAIDDPLKRDPTMVKTIKVTDHVLTGLFTVEIILKSIAYGFVIGHKRCYLREPMNMIDTFVVVVSIINLFMDTFGYKLSMQLHALRALRLVRMLKVSSQLKCVINCLIHSLKKIFYFLVMYILLLFVYSVIGVHLYKGSISHCSDISYMTETMCIHHNKTWSNNELSFDNLGTGLQTLFVLSTLDDWFLFLTKLINIKEKSDYIAIAFVVSFIMLMSFIVLNVFIGLVIILFQREREKDEEFKVLDKSAQDCIRTALSADISRQEERPTGFIREHAWQIASADWFQTASMLLILLNTGFLMTKHTQQSSTFTYIQHCSNIVFTVLFTIEVGIKMIAFTWRILLTDNWVTFDAVVIFGSWVDVILNELKVNFVNLSIFRLFRVARLAQLVGKGGNLRELFNTFLKSMKCVPSIACLIALLLYFYAVLGMNIFGKIRLDDNTAINRHSNFQSFPQAVLVLIRVTTLDSWHRIMLSCADVYSINCEGSNENCGTYFSYIYFASFVFVCSYIMTNLFLAFIMDNFMYLTLDISTLDARQIHRFTSMWCIFDRRGEGSIQKEDLIPLLRMIDPPLGCGTMCPLRNVYYKLLKTRVPIEPDGTVKFNELILILVIDLLKIPAEKIESTRDDVYKLFPNIEDEVVDRVLPLSYDPRVLNHAEKDFYQECASFVITGYCKVYRTSLITARKLVKILKQPSRQLIAPPLKLRLSLTETTAELSKLMDPEDDNVKV